MIQNDEQLAQTREAINDLESAVLALRRDVLPLNGNRFTLMAEAAVDQIRELRSQVEEYVGVSLAESDEADFWMRIEGPGIELGDAPTSVITAMLDILRRGIQTVAEFMQHGSVSARPTASLKEACDLRIIGWMPGSVQVGMRLPEVADDPTAGNVLSEQVNEALGFYLKAAAWAGSDQDASELEQAFPDAESRRLLLNQINRIVPRPRGAAERVEFSGRRVGDGSIRLERSTRARVNTALTRAITKELVEERGLLREIDLDQRSFRVRDPKLGKDIPCKITSEAVDLLDIAIEALDHAVVVRGVQRTDPTRRITYPLDVEEIEVLDQDLDEVVAD